MQTQPVNNPIIKTVCKKPISFKGYENIIDNKGREFIEFYAPAYDRNKYSLSLKTIPVQLDEKSDWVPKGNGEPYQYSKSSDAFEKDGIFYVSKEFLAGRGILKTDSKGKETGLGYQFVLTPKEGGNSFAVKESGTTTSDGQYNVIPANSGLTGRSGVMYHAFFNSLSPSQKAKESKAIRTHFNDFGTTIQGVRDLLKTGVLDSYSYLLSTPLTGKMHGYWSENLFQVYRSLGSMEDFRGLSGDLFDKGLNWVNDGTFTSQGLKSPQFQNVLKYDKESPYYHWFKVSNGKKEIGILPAAVTDPLSGKKNEGRKHVKYAIINAPQKEGYDKKRATYIQFYDDRLVEGPPADVIENYSKFNTKDPYEIKAHQDSIVPYYFEIDPNKTDMKALSKQEGVPISDIENVKNLLDFDTFSVVDKKDAKGMDNWYGNTDIVKMNLSNSRENIVGDQMGSAQVRNFLYQVASYWTKMSTDALLEHNARNLARDKEGTLKGISSAFGVNLKGVAQSIAEGNYTSQFLESNKNQKLDEFLLDQISQYPLDAIEFSQELSAILGSPYVTMRPVIMGDQSLTRYDMVTDNYTTKDIYGDQVKTGKSYGQYMAEKLPEEEAAIVKKFLPASERMNSVYRNQIMQFVRSTLVEMDNFNKEKGKANEGNLVFKDSTNSELTPYGRYVAKIVTPEIVKFSVVSALFGNDSVRFDAETGRIRYNYDGLRKKGIRSLGISPTSPKEDAEFVVKKIDEGMKLNLEGTYGKNLAKAFTKRFEGTNLKDFQISEAILQKTKSGLNWRFDALKDVADLEARRNYTISFEKCWDEVIDFWGNFMKSVKAQNPASYSIAEITDLWEFQDGAYHMSNGIKGFEGNDFGKYINTDVATRVLLEKTGITTFTNYNYLFSPIVGLFGRDFEKGELADGGKPGMMENLKNKFEMFLKFGPLSAVNSAHNMMSNPDKLHPMHLLSVNAKLFTKGNPEPSDRQAVSNVVGSGYVNSILSSKAIAVGQAYNKYFDNNHDIPDETKDYLKRAVKVLALGKTTESIDEKPDFMRADTFGARDFSITLGDVVKKAVELADEEGKKLIFKEGSNELDLKEDVNRQIFVDTSYEEITKNGKSKYPKMWEMYIGLGGNPSLYSGDEYAQSGFEAPAKNHHTSNREMIDHDVVKNPRRADTAEFNKMINAANKLHKRKELSALAEGAPVSLGLVKNNYSTVVGQAVYRNNSRGSEIITINTTAGMVDEWDKPMTENPAPIELDKLPLYTTGGLTTGMKFKKLCYDKTKGEYVNAKDKGLDTEEEYIVKRDGGGYYLERVVHYQDDSRSSGKVQLDNSTVILYKPESADNPGTISFKGNPHIALANLKYNIPV